ncbi:hypothetical protein K491DRAFT_696993 [Lophiostoma macrostomum CBS 122681]|uniref:Uncharacterized protein n=1 Tax=Lophiostoma macrostomum CBS 122681 TaxID=1314788 RepID=A0A6A6SUX4_9PLEO|nr:hypothetical protein K491DRAFT_696993 [Lophiostoma macrostomum CBS 122681]
MSFRRTWTSVLWGASFFPFETPRAFVSANGACIQVHCLTNNTRPPLQLTNPFCLPQNLAQRSSSIPDLDGDSGQ